MVAVYAPPTVLPLHPVHAILLAFPFPLFLGALAGDLAYWGTFQIQWANFSSWLIAGGLLGGGVAMIWALIELLRFRTSRALVYFAVLLVMWGTGLVNVLVHARDAWAIMPASLYLSSVAALLALVAAWVGYSGIRYGETV